MMWGIAAAVVAPAVVTSAAGAAEGAFDPYSLIGNAITPVLVVVLLLWGKLHTDGDYRRLVEENARKDAALEEKDRQLSALQAGLTDRAIPALTRATLVLEGLDATRFRRGPGDG